MSVSGADLYENFDGGSALPAGWVNGGTDNWTSSSHYGSPPNCRALGAADTLTSPGVDYPTNVAFHVDSSNAGNGKTATIDYSIDNGGWIQLASFTVGTAGSTRSFPLTGSPDLSASTNVRFRFNSSFNTWYLDNVDIRTSGEAPSNAPPALSFDPPSTSTVVEAGTLVTFVAVATEPDGDTITLSASNLPPDAVFVPNPVAGPSPVTNTFLWTPTNAGVNTITFLAGDKDGTNHLDFMITAFIPDPNLLLFEDFDASSDLPAGWVNGGSVNWGNAAHYASPPNCREMGADDTLETPPVDGPTNIAFHVDASTAGNGQNATIDYRIGNGPWQTLGGFTVSSAGGTASFVLTSSPDLSGSSNVTFRFNSSFNTWYLDDVAITGGFPSDIPPVLSFIGPQMAAVSQQLAFVVGATDVDGNDITLYASNLPPGASFSGASGTASVSSPFTFTPSESDAGLMYTCTFFAADIHGIDEEEVVITVFDRLVSFATGAAEATESAATQHIAIALSRPAHVTLNLAVSGTASTGDFMLATTQVVFTIDGSPTQHVDLVIVNDDDRETAETVTLSITDVVGAEAGPHDVFTLTILDDDVVYMNMFDTDPGWTTEGAWAFGVPLGVASDYGFPDPTAGHTGPNVYGYNLAGSYSNNLAVTHYLTTPAIDCSRFKDVRLRFWRWLGIESSVYDEAVIEASTDGMQWTEVWRHSSDSIADTAWTNVAYDISSLADGQPRVYIRWGLGPTDGIVRFCGWNIDDVSIEGVAITNPIFRFAESAQFVRETSGVAVITVQRAGLTNAAGAINYEVAGASAVAGSDFVAATGTLFVAPGQTMTAIPVTILDDAAAEGYETVRLTLHPTSSGETGTPASLLLTIEDDETPGASIPFFDGFESGTLGADWTTVSNEGSMVSILSVAGNAFEGGYYLGMSGVEYNTFALSELVLSVDLRGQTNVWLDFWEQTLDFEWTPMPETFSGTYPADGVAVSADGLTWRRLYTADRFANPAGYTNRRINISAFAAANNLPADSHFRIKFQHYDRYPIPIYGRYYDNIQLYDASQTADLKLSAVESEDPTAPGSNLVYGITVSNAGPIAAGSVIVTNLLPAGSELLDASSSQGSCFATNGLLVCELGPLPPGGDAAITVAVIAPAPTTLTSILHVVSDTIDPYTLDNRAELHTRVDEQGGTIWFPESSIMASEPDGGLTLYVLRTGRTYGAFTVHYSVVPDTAQPGIDYAETTGTLQFASGQLFAILPLTLVDDAVDEPPESFSVVLDAVDGGADIGSPATAIITITDDDGVAPFPFLETFESGIYSNFWSVYTSGQGRTLITSNDNPAAGARHVTMDSLTGYALNELVLTIDLDGQQGVTLLFDHRQFSDEGHTMTASFIGHQDSDGVAMSADGTNWVKVRGLTWAEGSSNSYGRFEVALDPIASAAGIAYTGKFRIKFQQYDNFPLPTDGFAFDNIAVFAGNGELRLGQSAYEVHEDAGAVTVTVARINGSLGAITFDYTASGITATEGADFIAVTGSVSLASGITAAAITIPVLEDADDEPAETFLIQLSNPTGGAALSDPHAAVIHLLDNDGPGVLRFPADEFAASEADGAVLITVLREGGAAGAAGVEVGAIAGSATADADFIPFTTTLFFADGVVSQSFTVTVNNDEELEDTETVVLSLANPSGGATIGHPAQATLLIVDDEDPNYLYYQSAFGKTGEALRVALHDIIDEHQIFTYDTLWTILRAVDEHPVNTNEVLLIYQQVGRDKFNAGGSPGQWNREHVWPVSHGFSGDPDTSRPPSVDAHHIRASDVELNAIRGDKDFEDGGDTVSGAPPSCRVTSGTFEPPDASKGDVARMIFYMDVRYAGDVENEPDLQVVESANTSGTQLGRLSTLMRWHYQDPPDERERRRNDIIHNNWQGNRNPFIDHPEWVADIWGSDILVTTITYSNGTVSPANPVVAFGSSQGFQVEPAPYFRLESLLTNGSEVSISYPDGSLVFTWSNLTASGTLEARFAPRLVTNGTPEWWLAEHGFTNDLDAAALADPDDDGVPTWEEYVAGTIPTNPASVLALQPDLPTAGGAWMLSWPSVNGRLYSLWIATNLVQGFTDPIALSLPATPPLNLYTVEVNGVSTPAFQLKAGH